MLLKEEGEEFGQEIDVIKQNMEMIKHDMKAIRELVQNLRQDNTKKDEEILRLRRIMSYLESNSDIEGDANDTKVLTWEQQVQADDEEIMDAWEEMIRDRLDDQEEFISACVTSKDNEETFHNRVVAEEMVFDKEETLKDNAGERSVFTRISNIAGDLITRFVDIKFERRDAEN